MSDAALALLHRRIEGEVPVTPEDLPAYRELVSAGKMMPMGSFAEASAFWFTEAGWDRRFELIGVSDPPILSASPDRSPSPDR